MNELATQDLIEGCVDDFKAVKRRIADGTEKLYKINKDNLWAGYAESFSEFCEVDLGISKSFASKLLKNWEYYVIQNGVSQEKLQTIDSEKLYLGINLPNPIDEKIEIIEGNSRRDIQKWVRNEGEECTHEGYDHIIICSNCRARI